MSLGVGKIERPAVLWRQIATQIRNQILSGLLPVGTRLPSNAELTVSTGTNHFTVQKAMSELAREGLITRQRKSGTFVSPIRPGLRCLGIYHAMAFPAPSCNNYVYRLHLELQSLADLRGVGLRVWNDQRPDQSIAHPDLQRAVLSGEVQGVISTVVHAHLRPWLAELPVALTMQGPGMPGLSSASFDTYSFFEVAMKALHKQGARSVGMIVPFRKEAMQPDFERCTKLASRLAMRLEKEWLISLPEGVGEIHSSEYEAYGYQAYDRFHCLRKRPEAVMVYPDTIARGVVLSVVNRRVRVPERLRLALHTNDEVGLFCPFPFIGINSSIRDLATVLLDQIDDLIAGGKPHRRLVRHSRVATRGLLQSRAGRIGGADVRRVADVGGVPK